MTAPTIFHDPEPAPLNETNQDTTASFTSDIFGSRPYITTQKAEARRIQMEKRALEWEQRWNQREAQNVLKVNVRMPTSNTLSQKQQNDDERRFMESMMKPLKGLSLDAGKKIAQGDAGKKTHIVAGQENPSIFADATKKAPLQQSQQSGLGARRVPLSRVGRV